MKGVTDEQRLEWWKNPDQFMGMVVKYKFLPIGIKDKPRHPIFLGFRSPVDLFSTT
jgi:DNA ligase-1